MANTFLTNTQITQVGDQAGSGREYKSLLYDEQRRLIFSTSLYQRKHTTVFTSTTKQPETIYTLADHNPTDIGRILLLLENVNGMNMIMVANHNTGRAIPASSKDDIRKIMGFKSRAAAAKLIKLLEEKSVYVEVTTTIKNEATGQTEKKKRFIVSPIYTMPYKGLSLDAYLLFKEQIDLLLPDDQVAELERIAYKDLYGEDRPARILQPKTADQDFIDRLIGGSDDGEEDKLQIFNELILHNEPAQTYQLLDRADGGKKMVAHELTQNTDTYYLVNRQAVYKTTKPSDADIVGYRSWFIDIDAGRDQDGNYFPLEKIAERKKAMMQVIDKLPTPTAIIDTRNGYHIYFSIFGDVSSDEWQELQDRLIEVAGIADTAVRDKARVLRLPGSIWVKAHTGLDPYNVTILKANKQAYDIDSFAVQLDQCAEATQAAANSYRVCYPMAQTKKSSTAAAAERGKGTARINAIAALSTDTFAPAAPVTQQGNIIDYLHGIDLAEFLQISTPKSFKCVIHDDHSPSATIYANDIGGYRYFCGSPACDGNNGGRGLDIIDVVRALSGCSCRQAIAYICKVYGIGQAAA